MRFPHYFNYLVLLDKILTGILHVMFKNGTQGLVLHHDETFESVRLVFVFWGVVVLHTPAFFPSYHLLFSSRDSRWMAFTAADVKEACGPGGDRWVWETDAGGLQWCELSQTCVIYFLYPTSWQRGIATRTLAYLPDGWYVSGTTCSALGRDRHQPVSAGRSTTVLMYLQFIYGL